jgi:chromosome partition protein MukF
MLADGNIEPHRVIATLARSSVSLDLKTIDLCFLAGMHLRADEAGLAAFEEEVLVDLFEQVCDAVEPEAENPRKRATHAIQRLRDQRMLARVDGAGIVRAGEYSLTRLAAAIVESFLKDDALTRESLTVLTGILGSQLAEILAGARKASDDEGWRARVIAPLRIAVAELVAGIERRQRGLDAQQEEVQGTISRLLAEDWHGAIDRCQELLDTTTSTLRELNAILLHDTQSFLALLQDIQALAATAGKSDAEATVQRVVEQVDRIAKWGSVRQSAWSEYYQRVLRYLQDVVRLDPSRALSQRLRDQLAEWPTKPFHLLVARSPALPVLREQAELTAHDPVSRPRTDRDANPEWVEPEQYLDALEAAVKRALAEGASSLAEVTTNCAQSVPEAMRYAAIGAIAEIVAANATVDTQLERPWVKVPDRLEIEEWTLRRQSRP